jgi:photosystem II stability/assembly factor-like uncharacterized protein
MADNDDLDKWLGEKLTPLPPPEGTFQLIKRRARRRKARKLAVTLTAAAAVVVAAILIPRVTLLQVSGPSRDVATGQSVGPSVGTGHPGVQGSGTQVASPSSSPAAAEPPVPANFQPTSVTFISTTTAFVIGQAGTPGDCATQYCTSIARTDNGGQSWYGVPAPETGGPDGSSGVSQIRFLNGQDGWAFGPQLWATDDGGQTWTQVSTGGQRVIRLETVGDRAFAILATCSGTGADYASGCTSFTLETALASSDSWTPILSSLNDASQSSSPALALTGSTGYLLGPNGRVYSGSVSSSAAWTELPASSCSSGILLAAGTPSDLALVCGSSLLLSSDSGQAWTPATSSAPLGTPASLAETSTGTLVLAGSAGIEYRAAGSSSWTASTLSGGLPSGGFTYVGMTTPTQGVAVPADASLHEIWMTSNGGQSWYPVPITGP